MERKRRFDGCHCGHDPGKAGATPWASRLTGYWLLWRGAHGLAMSALSALLCTVTVLIIGGCSTPPPPREVIRPEQAPNPLPRFLRGTVRYEAELQGYGPALVQGYGLVVGLDRTGSNDTPIPIRVIIEKEAARMLMDRRISGTNDFSVADLLNSKDTAVVLVEAAIPAGAPAGSKFDVQVRAIPATSTTSLEGGRLWTTRLTPGFAAQAGLETPAFAKANGDLFINPFVDSAESAATSIDRRVGRVLNGGVAVRDMPLLLKLRNPSFSRSRAIINAINSRFPQEPGQQYPTAVAMAGRSDEQIRITVPTSYRTRTPDFIETVMHTSLYTAAAEQRAAALARWITQNPIDAPEVAWCWVALGELALPVVRELYDHAQVVPRLAALKAGAKLGDPSVVALLSAMAVNPDNETRAQAVKLLSEMPGGARISLTLRRLLDDPDLELRITAFEGLLNQGDPAARLIHVGPRARFQLFAVPSAIPMIYITQQGQPRIVVFGTDIEITRPLLLTAWSGRFMLAADSADEPLRLYYRDRRTGEAQTYQPRSEVLNFIRFLGGETDVDGVAPGLALDFGQTVGALFALHRNESMNAPLVPERDRLVANITRGYSLERPELRPETDRAANPGTILQPDQPDESDPEGAEGSGSQEPASDRAPSSSSSVGSSTSADRPESAPDDGQR